MNRPERHPHSPLPLDGDGQSGSSWPMTDSHTVLERTRLRLSEFRRLFILTGAGCSTPSGIPDYRDAGGDWKRPQPMRYQSFVADPTARQRYWARSQVGWERLRRARPNPAHTALARLEHQGRVEGLVTQNVDGLHQAAGSTRVLELHGRLADVICLDCGFRLSRVDFQEQLARLNGVPDRIEPAPSAPDGDAERSEPVAARFQVPACPRCRGVLKPDVVFFGESIPSERVDAAYSALARSDLMVVVGSSLMVYSGYRFCRHAARIGIPIVILNRGRTRADDLAWDKLDGSCETILPALIDGLSPAGSGPGNPHRLDRSLG